MIERRLRVRPEAGGIRFRAGLVLSFQRFALPATGVIDRLPPSLGALPAGVAQDGTLMLPVADGEAFWIGASTDGPDGQAEVMVSSVLSDGRTRVAPTLRAAPSARLAGLPRGDGGYDAFTRTATTSGPGCDALTFRCRIRQRGRPWPARFTRLVVRLAGPDAFAAATGVPPPGPLDPGAGYGGWRLP
jgi:hypothetical protein